MSYDYYTTAIRFIESYRQLEKGTKAEAHNVIINVVKDKYTAGHLCRSWNGRQQDFGDFYLNLSNSIRYLFLKFWGLSHPDGDRYVDLVRQNEIAMLWADVPHCIEWFTELLKFFNNHGIIKQCETGVTLVNLPPDYKCYGNSCNWGNYLLSLQDEGRRTVLNQIAKCYEEHRSKQS
ncbi:hypothetical protein A3860_17940 [Niastella vici]|uniref:Uncharacterized protein n=1 Tax=Niastella vici TaxID=1703345 RepID=A0A1V9G500_9BACT|nr:hypothetical protein [Niastella vici]OQP65546.1 hypothetical protein A3860_17940 [Niastella vici]